MPNLIGTSKNTRALPRIRIKWCGGPLFESLDHLVQGVTLLIGNKINIPHPTWVQYSIRLLAVRWIRPKDIGNAVVRLGINTIQATKDDFSSTQIILEPPFEFTAELVSKDSFCCLLLTLIVAESRSRLIRPKFPLIRSSPKYFWKAFLTVMVYLLTCNTLTQKWHSLKYFYFDTENFEFFFPSAFLAETMKPKETKS